MKLDEIAWRLTDTWMPVSIAIPDVTNNFRDIKLHYAFVVVRDLNAMNDAKKVARILQTVPHH